MEFRPVSVDDGGELVQLTLSRQPRCPYCRDDIRLGQALLVCPACHAVLHQECLGKGGRCTTYGCRYGQPIEEPRRRPRRKRIAAALAVVVAGAGLSLALFAQDDPPPPPPPPLPAAPTPPIRVVVGPQPEPSVPAPDQRRALHGLYVPTVVDSDEVIIRGQLDGEGPLSVSVRGPTGSISWDALEPGPFATAVTLPGRGRHEIVVVIRDVWGRASSARYLVTRR